MADLVDNGIDFLPIILDSPLIKFDNDCCIATSNYKHLIGGYEYNKRKVRFYVYLSSDWPANELLPFMEWKEIERLEAQVILTKDKYNQIIKHSHA